MKCRLFLAIATTVLLLASNVFSEEPLFLRIAETRNAPAETVKFFDSFFTAKSRHDVGATMAHFSPKVLTYTDATLGWPLNNYQAIQDMFQTYMPDWGQGRSYPLRIVGGPESTIVLFVDTPELFGGEIRLIGSVDFAAGKIVRWIDYWDSTGFANSVYEKVRTPTDKFPTDFREKLVVDKVPPAFSMLATRVQSAFSAGDIDGLTSDLSYDVIYEDLALRTQILGREATIRYLKRAGFQLPFGVKSVLNHIVGGVSGGGFEWRNASGEVRGVTALELNESGKITRMYSAYDGRLIKSEERQRLILLSSDE